MHNLQLLSLIIAPILGGIVALYFIKQDLKDNKNGEKNE